MGAQRLFDKCMSRRTRLLALSFALISTALSVRTMPSAVLAYAKTEVDMPETGRFDGLDGFGTLTTAAWRGVDRAQGDTNVRHVTAMSPLRVSANTVAIGNVRAEVDAASPASTLTEFVSFMRDYTSVSKASGVKDDCVYYKDARYSNYFDYYQAFAEDLYPDEHDESNLSYENLMRGIRVMRGVNAAREEQGLPALKVSPMLMAGQIVEVDVNDGTTGDIVRHSNMRSANGNLAWGSSPEGVARVWMSEKDEYDRFVAADPTKAVKGVQGATSGYDTLYDFYINNLEEYQKVGHYLTIVDPSNRSMGAFYSEDASGWSASAKTGTSDLTVDQFEQVVRNAMVDAEPSDTDVSRASVDAIPDQTFTGSPLEPRPTVRLGGRTLSEGVDYGLSFGGNAGIGTATVTVTGRGTYTGAKSVTFRIGFSDVPAGHWALAGGDGGEGYLAAVVRMGLMTGYGDPATGRLTGRFGPEDGVTRAQVVTVLYRYANPGSTDTTTGAHADNATSLSDNESGQYYTAAVNWAVRTGVVTGYTAGPDAGRFVPDREISREELATMVHRFAALEGASDSVPDSAYGGAPDAGDVSGWASGHVAWCYAHQVLTGHADTGLLEPQGTATRAQMAKMAVLTIKAMGR